MEPMNLGSPVASPVTSPSFYLHNQSSSFPVGFASSSAMAGPVNSPSMPPGPQPTGFLPGYLMGDFAQQGSGSAGGGSGGILISPTKMNRPMAGSPSQQGTPKMTPAGMAGGAFLTPSSATLRTPATDKAGNAGSGSGGGGGGGPPITGLFSTPKRATQKNMSGLMMTPTSCTPHGLMAASTPQPSTPHLSFGATPLMNRVNSDPNAATYSANGTVNGMNGFSDNDNTWVTVFGFPTSAANYILSQFSQCGTILQHHMPPSGNWMHLRFQTRMQAQKALGRSGCVFSGTLMVGVLPTSDTVAANTGFTQQQEWSQLDCSVPGGISQLGGGAGSLDCSSVMFNSSVNVNKSMMRPLTQVSSAKSAANELDISVTKVPNKNDSIVSKAIEYIFGW